MSQEHRPILIAGAGPGGLCAALTLQRRGIPCLVLERSDRMRVLSDVGGAYDIGVNSMKMLDSLGVGDAVREQGRKTAEVLSYTHTGALFDRMPFPEGMDVVGVMRSTLQRILLDALDALDSSAVRCDARIVDVKNDDASVEVTLASGEQLSADVLVGADGVRSTVRQAVFQDDVPPHFCGLSCAWGRTPLDEMTQELTALMPAVDRAINVMGPGRILLAGCLGDQWVWSAFWQTETFERSAPGRGSQENVAKQFEGWGPMTRGLIDQARPETIVEVGIWDRDPAPAWTVGRTVIIGDAAHPMTPFLGQGANSAMIDAFVLGNLLADETLESAFPHFEERRKRAVEKNVKSARSLAGWMTTTNRITAFAFRSMMRLTPSVVLRHAIMSADQVNDVDDLVPRIPSVA